jgi:hypothetical protein
MYNAVVARIKTAKHPNADRLQIGYVNGARVVVGLDTEDNELGLFFEADGQLSKEYCDANDLIPRYDENRVKIGGGYFPDNRRVKAQNFRQVKSEGFFMPLSSVSFTGYDISRLKEGDVFDTLNKVPICNKFYTKATLAAMKAKGKKSITKKVYHIPEHYDTGHFRFAHIEDGSLIHISEKEHGTSFRFGNVKVSNPLGWKRRLMNLLLFRSPAKIQVTQEDTLGTRRAILQRKDGKYVGGYYGDGEPYSLAAQKLSGKLFANEIVYGEIVGYTSNGSALFSQNTTPLKDIMKTYGARMVFSYGCVEGTTKVKIYRITQNGRELSWYEVKQRAAELGVETISNYTSLIYDGDRNALNALVESYLEGPSTLDERHIREGVCLRVENEHGIRIHKAKSWTFGVLEGYIKDDENYVDAEEIA